MRSRTLGAVCATCAFAVPVSTDARAQSPAASAADQNIVSVQPPSSISHAAKLPLIKRYLRWESRRQRLRGGRLTMRERDRFGMELSTWTAQQLRTESRKLAHKVRKLRRKIERERHGGAPNISVPGALKTIAQCESGGNPRAISASGAYRGKYQFDHGTWASVGGRGDPAGASEIEQDRRAALLYRRAGATPWPVCGRS